MGFSRRKARQARELRRRKPRREPYAKVLIVCEGEKTEPNYFKGLKDYYRLNSANVEICGEECGSDPVSIIEHAKELYDKEGAGDPFDRVYCVFDKDNHTNYAQAVDAINRVAPKNTFFAITSVPCFEYWLILHFIYTTKSYSAMSGKSACFQLTSALKKYLPDYDKGQRDVFSSLEDKLETAKANAVKAFKAAQSADTDDPSTRVHELVDFLQNIKMKNSSKPS
ncbi:MAG: RloB family protein [Candidatus Nitrospinota bacterium M3_3B_026]